MDLRSTLWPVSRSSLLGSPRTEVPIYRSTSLPHPTPANPAFNGLPLAVYSIPHPHQRPRARLTVEKGADPGTRPAPRGCACLARAPYLRRLLIGFWGAARALRDGGGAGWGGVEAGRFHHQLPACKWRLGGQEARRGGERTGTGHSGTGLGIPEAAPREGPPEGGRGIAGPT